MSLAERTASQRLQGCWQTGGPTRSGCTTHPQIRLGHVSTVGAQGAGPGQRLTGAGRAEESPCPGDHKGYHSQGPFEASAPSLPAAVTWAPSAPSRPPLADAPLPSATLTMTQRCRRDRKSSCILPVEGFKTPLFKIFILRIKMHLSEHLELTKYSNRCSRTTQQQPRSAPRAFLSVVLLASSCGHPP